MATLTGNKPKDTYKGLIKTIDSQEVSSAKQLSDGDGNALPIEISQTSVTFTSRELRDANGAILTTYRHDQTASDVEWVIQHELNKFPNVVVIDSTNSYVIGEVEYIDPNLLIVRFKAPFKGVAYLN